MIPCSDTWPPLRWKFSTDALENTPPKTTSESWLVMVPVLDHRVVDKVNGQNKSCDRLVAEMVPAFDQETPPSSSSDPSAAEICPLAALLQLTALIARIEPLRTSTVPLLVKPFVSMKMPPLR